MIKLILYIMLLDRCSYRPHIVLSVHIRMACKPGRLCTFLSLTGSATVPIVVLFL